MSRLFSVCPKCEGFGEIGKTSEETVRLIGGYRSSLIDMVPCDLCEGDGYALNEEVFEYQLSGKVPERE